MSAPLVTLSATYGAGGAFVGPRVAEQLGVPFLDRAIPVEVSQRLAVALDDALAHDERTEHWLGRILAAFALVPVAGAAAPVAGAYDEHVFTEAEKRQQDADRARKAYVQHFYRADPTDPRHYHLVLDSTALGLDACVEVIVAAARARAS